MRITKDGSYLRVLPYGTYSISIYLGPTGAPERQTRMSSGKNRVICDNRWQSSDAGHYAGAVKFKTTDNPVTFSHWQSP